jgi:hypothetical protein
MISFGMSDIRLLTMRSPFTERPLTVLTWITNTRFFSLHSKMSQRSAANTWARSFRVRPHAAAAVMGQDIGGQASGTYRASALSLEHRWAFFLKRPHAFGIIGGASGFALKPCLEIQLPMQRVRFRGNE